MGSKVGKIALPLVALGATALVTGPAGMGLWGASSGAAGVGAGAAAGAATASAVPGALAAAEAGNAALGAGLVEGAGLSMTAPASEGILSTIASEWGNMSLFQKAGLGLSGVSTAGSVVGSVQNTKAQKAAIAAQEEERKLTEARDRLEIADSRAGVEDKLARTLAGIAALEGAAGSRMSPSVTEAAASSAQSDRDLLAARESVVDAGGTISGSTAAINRRLASSQGYGGAFGSLIDFGMDSFDVLSRRSRVGRA